MCKTSIAKANLLVKQNFKQKVKFCLKVFYFRALALSNISKDIAMNVLRITQAQSLTNRILTNKKLLRSLEKLSEHGTSFSAATSLLMTIGVRPLMISMTPNVEKENKQYAMSNSICSGLIKFGMLEAVTLPLELAVKRIDDNPDQFLNNFTIKNLKNGAEDLAKSRSYRMITQIYKLGTGLLTAIPKSILTVALIPIIMDLLNKKNPTKPDTKPEQNQKNFDILKDKNVFFTGNFVEKVAKGVAKGINTPKIQNLAKKYEKNDKDIAKHLTATTDILLTATNCQQTASSKRIKEDRKRVLIYNNIISTGITLLGGYGVDLLMKNKTRKFIEKFKQLNAADPKVLKYVEGINILRPTIIFSAIYYGILPMFSTYLSEKIDKHTK